MLFRTHVAAGILLGLAFYSYASNAVAFFLGALLFSSFPDIDHWRSMYGKFLGIGRVMQFIFHHRGFLHSLLFAGGLYWVFTGFGFRSFGQGMVAGYFGHVILDGLTKQGVLLLYPFRWLRLRGPFVTGGMVEGGVFLLIVAGIFAEVWQLFFHLF